MTFKCNECGRIIRVVNDIRSCAQCNASGRATSIPSSHSGGDWITPALMGYVIGMSMQSEESHASSYSPAVDDAPSFSGGGGDSGGGGASESYDSGSSDSGSSDSSSSASGGE